MAVRFEEQGDGRFQIIKGDKPVGVAIQQQGGGFGYSLFGTPHMGRESSLEDVEKAVQRHLH